MCGWVGASFSETAIGNFGWPSVFTAAAFDVNISLHDAYMFSGIILLFVYIILYLNNSVFILPPVRSTIRAPLYLYPPSYVSVFHSR